jgi:hypothetical protein
MEIQAGKISTWLSPNGEVCRVKVVSVEDGRQGRVFTGYRVNEKDEPLQNKAGFFYPTFSGTIESLGG